MTGEAFQLNKLRRLIRTNGKAFLFTRPDKDEFGEPNGETVSHEILGVYHETSSGYATKSATEATTIRKKALPMGLALWESAKGLHHQDELTFSGKQYKINDIKNIAEASLVADISLEEVQT